jgi:AmiR/NasT family two-component response regulator
LVRIDSHDGQLAQALIAALAEAGVAAVWSRTSLAADADAIVWDGAQMSGREAAHLAAVGSAARDKRTPVVALLGFPRPETVAAAVAMGAAAVIGKPFAVELLLDSLSAAMRETTSDPSTGTFSNPSQFTASPRRESWEVASMNMGGYPRSSHDLRRRLAV